MSKNLINLFRNNFEADVTFHIENENIRYPAHKLIIGQASDVVNKMVYGNDASLPTSIIVVPNYSSMDFLPVLKYLYTGSVEWTFDNYDGILGVGEYFGLTELENMFTIYVANTVTFDNALDIYERFFHVNDYICRTAMKIIQIELAKILESQNKMVQFFEMSLEAVSPILEMDDLGISERDLFDKMVAWAKTKDQHSVSSVLGNKLKLIRFADLEIEELENYAELEEMDTRWKIETIHSSNDVISRFENEDDVDDSTEVIEIGSRGIPIRLHGLSTLSSEQIYVKNKDQFEPIPCYLSKVFKNDYYHLMFEKPIEISQDSSIQIKVPTSSKRSNFEDLDNDFYFVRATHLDEYGKNLPIGAIYISTLMNAKEIEDEDYEDSESDVEDVFNDVDDDGVCVSFVCNIL